MEAIEALKTRRSVRAFEERPVPKEILEDLIDCARLAPTARGEEPWEFVVVTDRDVLRWLAQTTDYGPFIAKAAACVAVICRESKYFLEDGSAATENILLAARANGLGSCWVAGDKKPYAPTICRKLGAPDGFRLISLVAIGYPAEHPERKKRPLAQVLHWEKF